MKLSEAIEEIRAWWLSNSDSNLVAAVAFSQALEILAKVEEPVWTDAKPTREGWWWHRVDGMVEVLNVESSDGGELTVIGYSLSDFTGEWSSEPISMPGERS